MRRFRSVGTTITLFAVVTASALAGGPVGAQGSRSPTGPPGTDRITERQLRSYLAFLSSDLLEGRGAPSRGLDIAAAFLSANLERLGLTPAGSDGTYLQQIGLTRRQFDPGRTTLSIGRRTFVVGDGFLAGAATGTAKGPAVYVGNGTVIRSRGVDPYRDLDVAGRIVISNSGLPAGFSQEDLKGPAGKDWEITEAAAAARGAVGVLFLPDYSALANWATNRDIRTSRTSLTVDALDEGGGPGLPTATLSAAAIGALFTGQKVGPQEIFQRAVRREPAAPFALSDGMVVQLSVAAREERLNIANVVAVLEGRDPKLKHEYVALGAHYDHLGIATTPDGDDDRIYNGADDDGSGTAALLAMADALATASPRPRRSVLFVWHTGEEKGLWGSRYFTEHPTVPIDRIVAQLNIDMIGRGRPDRQPASNEPLALTDMDSVYVVGSRRISPALAATLERVNARYHRLRFDYSLDAPGDPGQIFERSDHYSYARRGIPVAFFFTGLHDDYHGLGDEIDEIDFPKLRRIVQTIYAATRALADDREFGRKGR